jgi:hypothetical protein
MSSGKFGSAIASTASKDLVDTSQAIAQRLFAAEADISRVDDPQLEIRRSIQQAPRDMKLSSKHF